MKSESHTACGESNSMSVSFEASLVKVAYEVLRKTWRGKWRKRRKIGRLAEAKSLVLHFLLGSNLKR